MKFKCLNRKNLKYITFRNKYSELKFSNLSFKSNFIMGRRTTIFVNTTNFEIVKECQAFNLRLRGVSVREFDTRASAKLFILENKPGKAKTPSLKDLPVVTTPEKTVVIGEMNFLSTEDDYIIVYTDGSTFNNGKANSQAGMGAYFFKNSPMNISKPVSELDGPPTNNVSEIMAAYYAILALLELKIEKINIKTDSQFLINSMTKWINGWIKNGWTSSQGKPVINRLQFEKLHELIVNNKLSVRWTHVKAHSNIAGNEAADVLAKSGASKKC